MDDMGILERVRFAKGMVDKILLYLELAREPDFPPASVGVVVEKCNELLPDLFDDLDALEADLTISGK